MQLVCDDRQMIQRMHHSEHVQWFSYSFIHLNLCVFRFWGLSDVKPQSKKELANTSLHEVKSDSNIHENKQIQVPVSTG